MPTADPARCRRPESVLVVVHTAVGEVLLLERSTEPVFWQSVTGALQWGETTAAAARRELAEETGIAGGEPRDRHVQQRFTILPGGLSRYAPGITENTEHVFTVELPARVAVRIDPTEHTRYQWLSAPAAAALVWSWTNREAILRWVAQD